MVIIFNTYRLLIVFILFFTSCKILEFSDKKPPKTRFNADKKEVELHDTVRLYWEVEEAQRVELVDFEDNLPFSGEYFVIPDTTTVYQLNVYREGEEVKKKRIKIYTYIPKISYFEVTDTVADDEDIEVRWSTRNAEKVLINHFTEPLRSSGKLTIRRDTTTMFILTMQGKYHTDTAMRRTVVKLEEEITYNEEIHRGQGSRLKWDLKRTDSVKIEGYDTVFSAHDEFVVNPDESKFINLIAFKVYGRAEIYPRYVTVYPPKIRFYGSKTILKSEYAKIGWSVEGGDSVKFSPSGPNVPFRGSEMKHVLKDTSVTIYVFDKGDILQQSFTIKVLPFRTLVNETEAKPYRKLSLTERLDFDVVKIDQQTYPDSLFLHLVAVDTSGYFIDGLNPSELKENELNRLYKDLYEEINGKLKKFDFTVSQITDTTSPRFYFFIVDQNLSYSTPIVHGIKKYIRSMKGIDKAGIINFGTEMYLKLPPESDTSVAVRSLNLNDTIRYGLGHAIFASLDSALKMMPEKNYTKRIILITNGSDHISFLHHPEKHYYDNLAQRMKLNQIDLSIISTGDHADIQTFDELSTYSGNYHYFVPDVDYVHDAINEIMVLDQNFYRIAYRPIDIDGSHKVVLRYYNRNSGFTLDSARYFTGYPELSVSESNRNPYWQSFLDMDIQPVFPVQTIAYFGLADEEIPVQYESLLLKLAEFLKNNENISVHLIGHSDLTGSKKMCDEIGIKRAVNIKEFLIDHGISPDRIKTHTAGKEFPVNEEEISDNDAAENRRVDAVFIRTDP